MRLFLFDIDGTLIDSGGAGTRSLNLAFQDLFDIADAFNDIRMAGRTDHEIISDALRIHGVGDGDGVHASIVEAYVKHLRLEIQKDGKHMKPGIIETLEALASADGNFLALLTGNIEPGARVKLEPFGLNRYFPFGAFGSDQTDRKLLLPVAVERFRRHHSMELSYAECVVVGDTPHDVACAKPYGAHSIAVATGPYTADELRTAGADVVLDSLLDCDCTLSGIIPSS